MREVFECRMCGHCCQGKGGIILQEHDLSRIAEWFGESEECTASRWTEAGSGKLKLRIGEDGYCVFFSQGNGCTIHSAKPDVCRAWPFFRGNLEDPVSLDLARDYCPGINKNANFDNFCAAGIRYIISNNLCAGGSPQAPNALKTAHLLFLARTKV